MKRNLVGKILGKIKIFVQDVVPIKTALSIPPSGGKISKRLGGIIGCKYKTSSWLIEFRCVVTVSTPAVWLARENIKRLTPRPCINVEYSHGVVYIEEERGQPRSSTRAVWTT